MTFSFSFSHMFLYLSLHCACYIEESLENGKWCTGGFPVRLLSFTAPTARAGSSPSNPLLHYLKGKELFLLHDDTQFF